jgi:membrane-bound lytic murein transglycosylase B
MSGTQFLREHGWQLGRELWWHQRLPEQGHSFGTALLQAAQWLAQDLATVTAELDEARRQAAGLPPPEPPKRHYVPVLPQPSARQRESVRRASRKLKRSRQIEKTLLDVLGPVDSVDDYG